jgi:hypothetical protein
MTPSRIWWNNTSTHTSMTPCAYIVAAKKLLAISEHFSRDASRSRIVDSGGKIMAGKTAFSYPPVSHGATGDIH